MKANRFHKKTIFRRALLVMLVMTTGLGLLSGCAVQPDATPTPTPSETKTPTGEGSATPTSTPMATPTASAEPSDASPSASAGGSDDPPPAPSDFETYQSNVITPTGNNGVLTSKEAVTESFRGVFRVQETGKFNYKLYFSNNVDSTWGDGSENYRNMPTKPYKIISAFLGYANDMRGTGTIQGKQAVTFDGATERLVEAGEMLWSDAVPVEVPEGKFLIFEWTVEYTLIPCTRTNGTGVALKRKPFGTVMTFLRENDVPLPDRIACDRGCATRVAFIGDSITMGEGTTAGMDAYWAAQIAKGLGSSVSCWNLGLGYARANDAVNSPAWLEKAKNNDVVVLCFGVNDINSGAYKVGSRTADQIAADIAYIADVCRKGGARVILFSTPPYTYASTTKPKWAPLVEKIKALAEKEGYDFFDFAACLGKESDPSVPAYGGHPDDKGCAVVAERFLASGLIPITTEEP